MKRVALSLLAAAVTAIILSAAQEPRRARSPDRLTSLTAEPMLDMNGTCMAFIVTAKFSAIIAHPSGLVDSHDLGSVQVDLMKSNGMVVVGDTQYDDKEVAEILCAVAKREWESANPIPLPQRRRAMRNP